MSSAAWANMTRKSRIATIRTWAEIGDGAAAIARRYGVSPDHVRRLAYAGGVHRLPRSIPLKIAMGMLLTGKPITAAEGARLGLVNEVVPLAELMPTAERWAHTICECSPLSVRATKQCVYDGLGMSVDEAMRTRFPAATALYKSEDLREGPRAFAEKRKPVWKGR